MSDYSRESSEIEEKYKDLGHALVVSSKTQEKLTAAIEEHITSKQEFQKLPLFRRYGVFSFIEGVSRGTAKFEFKSTLVQFVGEGFNDFEPKKKSDDVPRSIKKLQPGATWKRHPNGGGWVSSTAYVEATAKVGTEAIVYDNARVTGRAKIYGEAKVRGDAECYGTAHVHGMAVIEGHARVCDNARVLGKVTVGGHVTVGGNTVLRGEITLDGEEELIDERRTSRLMLAKEA